MNLEKITKKLTLLITCIVFTFSFTANAGPWDWGHGGNNHHKFSEAIWNFYHKKKRPDNLAKTMTFAATRAFDSVDGTFFVDGLIGGDGMRFFKQTMGFSDQVIERNRGRASEFFMERFGLDIADPRLYFTGFEIDPASGYRVIMESGENHKIGKGYPILDGGWGLVVMSPEGIDLGGEFEGTHVPAGSMFVHGNYLIKRGKGRKDLAIGYRSRGPILSVGTGNVINCEVFHPKLGFGVSLGYSEIHQLNNGQITAHARNVLTFPAFGYEQKSLEED